MIEPRAPAELRYLTEILGDAATLALIERRGGTRMHIPKMFDPKSAFAQEFGADAARELVRRYGGTDQRSIKVPLCRYWRARVYDGLEMTYPQIARKLGCSETTVWRYLHPSGEASRLQLALPLETS